MRKRGNSSTSRLYSDDRWTNFSFFSHDIGRIGYIPGRGFTVENNDPEILEILRELEKLEDFSPADIDQNQEFIQDFIRQCKKQSAAASSGKCLRNVFADELSG